MADHEVVEGLNIKQFACLHNGARYRDVIGTRRRISWSRGRDAMHRLLCAVFPTPLPKPDVRLSTHPAFY
jgi:hypothetical protein